MKRESTWSLGLAAVLSSRLKRAPMGSDASAQVASSFSSFGDCGGIFFFAH